MYTMRKLVYMILLVTFSTTCDLSTGGGLDRPPEGPKILRVEVSPEYITVGDTVTVRCVIEEKTDINYIYYWFVKPPSNPYNASTPSNVFELTPSSKGEYSITIRVMGLNPNTLETITTINFHVHE